LVVASVRKASADWLRLAEEEKAAVEDLALTEQIRDRIAVSARAGETARFDLTRAETEMAIARKVLDTVRLRALQTKVELRRVVGASLPDDFQVAARGALPAPLTLDDYERLRVELDERNPDLLAAQTDLKRARQEIQFERTQVLPRVTLRATHELDPSSALTRVGAQVSVPLLDQRQGPIAQAVAAATRAQAALDFKKLEIQQGFASAWLGWQAAQVQLQALDSGIVTRARAILGTAEAAYRFGERGILETLDAQRQFRIVRNELIAARHAVALARIELERLSGL
jgi:cobalt-zinc-cadmium efflux system outer membrane protein